MKFWKLVASVPAVYLEDFFPLNQSCGYQLIAFLKQPISSYIYLVMLFVKSSSALYFVPRTMRTYPLTAIPTTDILTGIPEILPAATRWKRTLNYLIDTIVLYVLLIALRHVTGWLIDDFNLPWSFAFWLHPVQLRDIYTLLD